MPGAIVDTTTAAQLHHDKVPISKANGTKSATDTSSDSQLEFAELPPFPNDIDTAPLLRISLERLVLGDPAEVDRLWKACCELGFFYLDLRQTKQYDEDELPSTDTFDQDNRLKPSSIDGNSLLGDVDKLFSIGDQVFDMPVSEKLKYDFKSKGSYFGYKGYGDGVIDAKGTKDRNEFYNVSKDDILSLSESLPAPVCLQQPRPLIRSYMERCHAIVTLILTLLNDKLGLAADTLTSLHRVHARSGDQLRWVRAPPQPQDDRQTALGAHTDFGSVTVLFNRLGGLQVLPPGEDSRWKYVKPLKGHAVVNLGDAMVKFTSGILRSNIHRVVNPPGEQGDSVRMSLVYFARPEDEVLLQSLEGSAAIDEARRKTYTGDEELMTAKDWILKRALGRRTGGNFEQSHGTEEKV